MSKKILIVANSSWNIVNFRANLILYLISKGFEVVVTAPEDTFTTQLKSMFPSVAFFPLKRLQNQSINPIIELKTFWELYKLYKVIKPDLVLHFTIKPNIWGGFAARINGIKSISTITGLGYLFINENYKTLLIKYLYKFSLKKSFVLFHNEVDRALFLYSRITNEKNSKVINGSGIDVKKLKRQSQPDSSNFTFLFVGRLLFDKGIREFEQAAIAVKTALPNTTFLVLGEMNAQNPSAISEHDLEHWNEDSVIQYLGFQQDTKPFYEQAHCFVLPSYREGLSKSILEAMSMELPVITTDVPGCNSVVSEPQNGFLVLPKDEKQLADAMRKMLQLSEPQRIEIGKNNRKKIVQGYSFQSINETYFELIQTLCQSK
jgi:glycosyltransferase involved in cell wall biosynthesis